MFKAKVLTTKELYAVIERESERGYRLTDTEFGLSLIQEKDIQGDGKGNFVIRFRLPERIGEVTLRNVVEDVCREIGYRPEIYRMLDEEYGIDFWDCAWLLEFDGAASQQ